MPSGVNKLREALLDAVDDRDEAIKDAADTGASLMRRVLAAVVAEAAKAGATQADIDAALADPEVQRAVQIAVVYAAVTADKHAGKAAALVLKAGKGRDEGPITRKHVEARRAARTAGGK
jgi:uncharacterized protein YjgD (DUF1641 family)